MLEENKIQDIFKQASLSDEDWLQPPEMVFQNIENAIYKKKWRRWLWLLTVTLVGALTFGFYSQFNNNELINNANVDEPLTSITKNEITEKTKNKDLIGHNNTNYLISKDEAKTTTAETSVLETKAKTSTPKAAVNSIAEAKNKPNKQLSKSNNSSYPKFGEEVKTQIKEKAEQIISNTSYPKNNFTVNKKDETLNKGVANLNDTANRKFYTTKSKSNLIEVVENVVSINERFNNSKQTVGLNNETVTNQVLNKLPLILPSVLVDENEQLNLAKLDSLLPDLPSNNWSFGVFSGFSSWDYSLNNNFKSTLRPFDFTYTNSIGYFVAVEANKTLSKKFSIVASLGFENISSTSGHNSTINYNPVNENNEGISSYDLKMASTLGFIDANLKIQRQDDVNVEATNVVIDLNNQHQISSIDLSAYLLANIFTIKNTNASARIGLGVAQIISLKNELVSFNTSLPALMAYKSQITAKQSEVNKTRPFIAFGGGLTHQFSAFNSLFIIYTFKSDFNTLYKSDDLSTFLIKHNVGLGYQRRF